MNAREVIIASSGQAIFSPLGGIHTVSQSLSLGTGSRADPSDPPPGGTYQLGNGTLDNLDISVERGHFPLVGGVHSVSGKLDLGPAGRTFEGVHTLSGGQFRVSRIVNGTQADPVVSGTGIFNLDGGWLKMNGSAGL